MTDGTVLMAENASGEICSYASFADLNADLGYDCVDGFNSASRFTLDGSTVYGAWHSTNLVRTYPRSTGDQSGYITLSDWDTWVRGMSVANGMLHLVNDDRGTYAGSGVRIARFDPATGTLLDHVFLTGTSAYSHKPSGLWCEGP